MSGETPDCGEPRAKLEAVGSETLTLEPRLARAVLAASSRATQFYRMFANVNPGRRFARIFAGLCISVVMGNERLAAQTISGRVYDSLSNRPLVGATVQLVASKRGALAPIQAITDSHGNYRLNGVPAGAYVLGFYHALLDSIGIEPPLVRVSLDGTSGPAPLKVDLGVPSAASIIGAVCGSGTEDNAVGVVVGHVYDAASRQPVSGGKVVAEWQRIALVNRGLEVSVPHLIATTTSAGGFAFCGVPRDDDILLTAIRGEDTTARVTVHVSAAGFAHRQLYVDKAELVTLIDRDSLGALEPTPNVVRRGHGRLAGTVIEAGSHRPVAGAQVTIVGTDLSAHANDRGAFAISGAPGGTQAVLVRAIGYIPEHRVVELLNDSTAALDVGLTTVRTMLDTMKITAAYPRDARGFEQRRKSGFGRFFDSTDVERRRPFETTRFLEDIPGIRLVGFGANRRILLGTVSRCEPAIFVDGASFPDFNGSDLDAMVEPEEIAGIEVYASATSAPAQYRGALPSRNGFGCGSILVWTKRRR